MDSTYIDSATSQVKHRLEGLRSQIAEAAKSAGRKPDEIGVVGVTKLHRPEMIAVAWQAGLTRIGESRVQEAAVKKPLIEAFLRDCHEDPALLRWHLIGSLQTNKAAKAVELFDVIESVDSLRLARIISRHAAEMDKIIRVFLEVNISGEDSKSGFPFPSAGESDFFETALEITRLPGIMLDGLMGIGPLTEDTGAITASFQSLRELRDETAGRLPGSLFGAKLSMGMSDDYPLAIAAGSTQIRVGTALFGRRG